VIKNPDLSAELVPHNVRLLSIVTGCFTAIAGSLLTGVFFSIYPGILALGAAAQPRWRRLGRGLMLAGALLLTSEVALFCLAIPESIRTMRVYQDRNSIAILSFLVVSVLLVGWCDAVLVANEIRMRRIQNSQTGSMNEP
jgi:hypothetical protein